MGGGEGDREGRAAADAAAAAAKKVAKEARVATGELRGANADCED